MHSIERAQPPVDRLLTAAEAATYLGVTRAALYMRVRRGHVPVARLGRLLRFRWTELAKLVEPAPMPAKETP